MIKPHQIPDEVVEAADAVGEVGDHADVGAYINAIRALVKEPKL